MPHFVGTIYKIIRQEGKKEESLEEKLSRYHKNKLSIDDMVKEALTPGSNTIKKLVTGAAYRYLFAGTLRKLAIQYVLDDRCDELNNLCDRYEVSPPNNPVND